MRRGSSRLLAVAALCVAACVACRLPTTSGVETRAGVVYGERDGAPLTLDVFRPAHPNGAGILFVQSGKWSSVRPPVNVMLLVFHPFLSRGFTVFGIRHATGPKARIPEIVEDVRRASRFVHLHAAEYGVDAERLGATGLSSGGHLALFLATAGDDGDPRAEDPVLRQASRVAAAVAVSPPTDLRTWAVDPPEAVRKLPEVAPRLVMDAVEAAACSPEVLVTPRTPPVLLVHGDRDEIVPLEHSRRMLAALRSKGRASELIVVEGGDHTLQLAERPQLVDRIVGWFVEHLASRAR